MEEIEFHLQVKYYVNRILVLAQNNVICEMALIEDNETKIFNGSIPRSYQGIELEVKLFAFGGCTEYGFAELFSKPFLDGPNLVIVNTPHEINHVFIDIPKELVEVFKKRYLILNIFNLKKWKDKDNLLSRGLDPQGKNFLTHVNLFGTEKASIVDLKFTVNCYENLFTKKLNLI